ncbi:transcriptional regulator, GntR family [Tistlia consotensis]|uniref:Transcriptional regulator, GntR family n=1 Tax=Tistlia consotensis USBA 355 TaxID=560819 RepID=A0A1Y6BKS4_9PROT|nr:GntR family transcriptional regulator [Tistlia consotensis]SMF16798.1 transcriptional regulator, GntR family [Tistlia consotensis USBA 355]SNR40880.1 transcriptional regulator, GntR family [Tistlia consotensis]
MEELQLERDEAAAHEEPARAGGRPAPLLGGPSLADQVYRVLRRQLMRGELLPDQRLKIRDLARRLGTSETPVREAIFQLVRDGALELKPRHYVRVKRLSLPEYLEIRDVRLHLEPLAAERALPFMDRAAVATLAATHERLIEAERRGDFRAALDENFDFHFGLYWRSNLPVVISILESLWMQVGPLLNDLYPHARPVYADRHQHEVILEALERRDAYHLREAVRQDLFEGGKNLVRHLRELEEAEGATAGGSAKR